MRFNAHKENSNKTFNSEGVSAYQMDDKTNFLFVLLTSFFTPKFYEHPNDVLDRILNLMDRIDDKKFIAQAAIFARTKFGMRTVSHAVAAEMLKNVKGEIWMKNFIRDVIYRPDDMLEIFAYYISKYKKPIPNSMKKGFALAFNKFDEYQLAKYKKTDKEFSLVDLVNLVHPSSNESLSKLMKNELKNTDTWEVRMVQAGQDAEDDVALADMKSSIWKELIETRKLGYFALLRNLRNILNQSPEAVPAALKMLTDDQLIRKSLVLPFRLSAAYKALESVPDSGLLLEALSDAAEIALQNVPEFLGKTLIVLDVSGSMGGRPADIGSLFASALVKKNDAHLMIFSDDAEYRTLDSKNSILSMAKSISFARGGTNFKAIFNRAKYAYDRIIILSDMQGWMGNTTPDQEYKTYKKKFDCDPIVYSFDLNGYGTIQFPENKVHCLAGFSDKTFDIMKLFEYDKRALLSEVEAIPL